MFGVTGAWSALRQWFYLKYTDINMFDVRIITHNMAWLFKDYFSASVVIFTWYISYQSFDKK